MAVLKQIELCQKVAVKWAITLVATFIGSSLLASTSQKITVGKFNSRAIWTNVSEKDLSKKRPVVILVPGSGAPGPEEMIPGSLTVDNVDHSIFEPFSSSLNLAGINTLALGKPGVEFFSTWNPEAYFYDQKLYSGLHWVDLIENVRGAVDFVRRQPNVDLNRIYILGHSEGTQVAVDYAAKYSDIKGLILLGVMDNDIGTTLEWQLSQRYIDHFVATDLDANHDGVVTKEEASGWPEFHWNWLPEQKSVSYQEIKEALASDPNTKAVIDTIKNAPLYADGIYNRGPIHDKAAALKQDLYLINGELDFQTRASEAVTVFETAQKAGKKNVWLTIVPGVGHGFSPPRPPRSQPLLDITVGPVGPLCRNLLIELGKKL